MTVRRDLELVALGVAATLGFTIAVARGRPQMAGEPDAAGTFVRLPHGQGHRAVSPVEIPRRGWWQVLKRVFQKMSDDRALTEAAGITFYALLALFPALAALVSLYGLFADPSTVEGQLRSLEDVLPGGGAQIITAQVHSLAVKSGTALSFGLVIGLATSLWSTNSATKALFDALNVVYEEKETRSYLRRTLLSFVFTLAGLVFVLVALAAVVVLPAALNIVGLRDAVEALVRWVRWPLLLVVMILILSAIYRFGPNRRHARWRWVTWGSALASLVWVVFSLLFSWYVASFGAFDRTYGSLGAAIGFMTWIWLSATIVLVGAELNAELEHQTARDTTVGAPKPLGRRGARKADTVAT
jgi:membrane protein